MGKKKYVLKFTRCGLFYRPVKPLIIIIFFLHKGPTTLALGYKFPDMIAHPNLSDGKQVRKKDRPIERESFLHVKHVPASPTAASRSPPDRRQTSACPSGKGLP